MTNEYFLKERGKHCELLGTIYAYTELDSHFDKSTIIQSMKDGNKLEFIKHMSFKDIPPYKLSFQKGEPVFVLRNLDTKNGIVKNKRCWVDEVYKYSVFIKLDNNQTYTIPRIKFKTQTNGIHFTRTQIPLKPLFAGTVHKSQGMTLDRGVIDLRSSFWEH